MIKFVKEKSKILLVLFLSILLALLFALSLKPNKVDYSGEYIVKSAEVSSIKVDSKKLIGDFELDLQGKKAKVIVNDTKKEYKVKDKKNQLELYTSSEKIKVQVVENDLKLKYNGIDLTLSRKE